MQWRLAVLSVCMAAALLGEPSIGAADTSVAGPPRPEVLPSDFLENVGKQTKARWRMLYRQPPPTPSADRRKGAFTLGGLLADSYLTLQAGHSQQFKNNNQEVLNYARVLGLAEKITPDILAEGKMAEAEDWPMLREKLVKKQVLISDLLREQRDDDLAILVELGMWLRLLEISSELVVNDADLPNKTLCIGSKDLLDEMYARYERLTESSRTDESVIMIGNVLQMLQRHWSAEEPPTNEKVQMTFEKLRFLMGKLTMK
ncbi:MAG: hypothetical protein ACAI34_14170 [Verrucomicrobium sp.]